jgi:hypothetical protein
LIFDITLCLTQRFLRLWRPRASQPSARSCVHNRTTKKKKKNTQAFMRKDVLFKNTIIPPFAKMNNLYIERHVSHCWNSECFWKCNFKSYFLNVDLMDGELCMRAACIRTEHTSLIKFYFCDPWNLIERNIS